MVLQGVKNGTALVAGTLKIVRQYPKFLLPLLVVWVVIAAVTIWQRFFFEPRGLGLWTLLAIGFGVIFLFALLLVLSCSILLEMIEQIERHGKEPSLFRAAGATLTSNIGGVLGLAFVWAVVWFVITVVQAIFEDDDNSSGSYSAEAAARTMAGGDGSLLSLSFDALKKGIRMLVFLTLPAIVWEDRGFIGGMRRGYDVFQERVAAFATGFSLTFLIAGLVFLPVTIVFVAADEGLITLSAGQWYLILAYIGLAWSFSIYLEQLFAADLFIWHLEWEQAVEAAEAAGEPAPDLQDVPRPSLLDDVESLSERKLPGGGSAPLAGEQ